MARQLTPEVQAALEAGQLSKRDFLWFTVKRRDTGAAHSEGYWSGIETVAGQVIDPETGSVVTRTFFGARGLIKVDEAPLISNLTVQRMVVTISDIDDRMRDLIRGYEPKQGVIQRFVGLFKIGTNKLVSPAFPTFLGYIDHVEINIPEEGGETSTRVECMSHTHELTRTNAAIRSDADQRLRSATDDFFKDVSTASNWPIFWGKRKASKVQDTPKAKPARVWVDKDSR